jgi:hypothetical protein
LADRDRIYLESVIQFSAERECNTSEWKIRGDSREDRKCVREDIARPFRLDIVC